MKAQVMNEGTMEDSYIFSIFNENRELTTKMLTYIKSASQVEEDMLEQQLLEIRKSRISPLLEVVLGAYARGEIEILYNKNVKIPLATPFIIRRDPSFNGNTFGVKASIFIANFGVVNKKTGQFDIPSKNLYVLLESAYVGLYIHTHPSAIQRNSGLMKLFCEIYTSMFIRILNKEYALTLDPDLYNRIAFIISKFFLEKLWELKNQDIIFNTACSNLNSPNYADLKICAEQYDDLENHDISSTLLFIKDMSPRLSNLSVKYIIQRFMMSYHGGAVMAIDYLPYMFYVVINTLLGGFLLNQTALADIVKGPKGIRTFYPELAKIIL